jgi:two-component system response regulator FixJ
MSDPGGVNYRQVHVVEDDDVQREALVALLVSAGYAPQGHATGEAFLDSVGPGSTGCAIIDLNLPGIDGIGVQSTLLMRGILLPVIMLTAHRDVQVAVAAMKAGAEDFLPKPCQPADLLAAVRRALELRVNATATASGLQARARQLLAGLTARERDVLEGLLRGDSNKAMARRFGISPRTVENHRARLMQHLSARSLSDVVRIALIADAPHGPGAGSGTGPGAGRRAEPG